MKHFAYYNENDPKAVAWLKELMKAGLIMQGEVDGRSIQDIRAVELVGYVRHHFFAGVAGWDLALRLAGWPEDRPILTASCPCQPFSNAGQQKGESDERHLWPVVHELIKELKPSVCIGEQVSSKLGRKWFSRVRTDLEDVGYAVGASDLCAPSISKKTRSIGEGLADLIKDQLGAFAAEQFREWWIESGYYALFDCDPGPPHIRQRLYWVADSDGQRCDGVHALLREEERGRVTSDLLEVARSDAIGGLADLCSTGLAQRERDGRVQREALERIQGQATIADSGFSGLANAQAAERRRSGRTSDSGWRDAQAGRPSASSGLADTDCDCDATDKPREESRVPQVNRETEFGSWEPGRTDDALLQTGFWMANTHELSRHGSLSRSGFGAIKGRSAWSDFDLIPCADGKTRRIESGTFPLVNGIPAGVVPGSDPSLQEVEATTEARVMRLKGFGNAIVPQLAAEFIKAFMQVKESGY